MKNKNEFWTEEQVDYLLEKYTVITNREIGEQLGKTMSQVNGKVQALRKKGIIKKRVRERAKPTKFSKTEFKVIEPEIIEPKIIEVELLIGSEYIVHEIGGDKRAEKTKFIGILIQNEKQHITLQHRLGYRETFLKKDLARGEYIIEKVG